MDEVGGLGKRGFGVGADADYVSGIRRSDAYAVADLARDDQRPRSVSRDVCGSTDGVSAAGRRRSRGGESTAGARVKFRGPNPQPECLLLSARARRRRANYARESRASCAGAMGGNLLFVGVTSKAGAVLCFQRGFACQKTGFRTPDINDLARRG